MLEYVALVVGGLALVWGVYERLSKMKMVRELTPWDDEELVTLMDNMAESLNMDFEELADFGLEKYREKYGEDAAYRMAELLDSYVYEDDEAA